MPSQDPCLSHLPFAQPAEAVPKSAPSSRAVHGDSIAEPLKRKGKPVTATFGVQAFATLFVQSLAPPDWPHGGSRRQSQLIWPPHVEVTQRLAARAPESSGSAGSLSNPALDCAMVNSRDPGSGSRRQLLAHRAACRHLQLAAVSSHGMFQEGIIFVSVRHKLEVAAKAFIPRPGEGSCEPGQGRVGRREP